MAASPQSASAQSAFNGLTPERILQTVETSLNTTCTNLCRPYNSYINRVYEIETSDGVGLVVKFYRPGRWSQQAVQEEHDFLLELAAEEIPVIAPCALRQGGTLGVDDNLLYAVFPRKGGRGVDELNEEQWLAIGRLLGRVHMVGARSTAQHRNRMHPAVTTAAQVDYILASGLIPKDLKQAYQHISQQIIAVIEPLFADQAYSRIHGDCHRGNLIDRPGESLYLIDFDDMVLGPPVQDIWMLLPGPLEEGTVEIDLFIEGYETFRPFDRSSLRLIEPLRAMRFIHYTAWCALQVVEDGKTCVYPDFGSRQYWEDEIADLHDQWERIRSAIHAPDNRLEHAW
ncbi:serine/threonine protein kinase [Desulfobulbus oligotrophicus]|uniref:Stress response kinase A n=1 Tax=Desulfobulbus oligotrophicus TaxID=1909699 RepID=A0A7T5VEZ5_9BACT|nr:serine/threonine protein kinase [Desulfobulbus oligotrophicus]QQG66581.1 serine/threonine protein kinase [Desulfobulbus oligotrophicus]